MNLSGEFSPLCGALRQAGIIHDLRNSLVLGVCNNCALFKCTAEHSNFYFLAAFSCGTIHILRQQKDLGLGGWVQIGQFLLTLSTVFTLTYWVGGSEIVQNVLTYFLDGPYIAAIIVCLKNGQCTYSMGIQLQKFPPMSYTHKLCAIVNHCPSEHYRANHCVLFYKTTLAPAANCLNPPSFLYHFQKDSNDS